MSEGLGVDGGTPHQVAVAAALGRVLGVNPQAIRPDSPLHLIGVDSLAVVCLVDDLAARGIFVDERQARAAHRVVDLVAACESSS